MRSIHGFIVLHHRFSSIMFCLISYCSVGIWGDGDAAGVLVDLLCYLVTYVLLERYQSTLDMSHSEFLPNYLYIKVNFLVPEDLF